MKIAGNSIKPKLRGRGAPLVLIVGARILALFPIGVRSK